MSVIAMAGLTVGALLLALGLSSSSRRTKRAKRDDSGDGVTTSGGDSSDCGSDGGGCD